MFSSCSAVAETLSITCQMFVDATREYHDKENIIDVIRDLDGKKDIIPFFLLKRQKMRRKYEEGYKYHTCCTPEATQHIINYLKYRIKREKSYKNHVLSNEDKLFKIKPIGINAAFSRINDHQDNNWGKKGTIRFFHPHAMRIAGNTAIETEDDGNLFSGRKRNAIQESYFKRNPSKIKEIYMQYIPFLSITETEINIVNDKSMEELKKVKKEHEKLEIENKALKDALKENQEKNNTRFALIESKLKNIDHDKLDELLTYSND